MAASDQGDIRRARFHIGNNVGRKNHDPFAREFRKQIAKADALFRIQSGGRLIHNKKLGIIQERLGNADALFHSTRVAAEGTLPGFHEVDHFQELLDSPAGRLPIIRAERREHQDCRVEDVLWNRKHAHPDADERQIEDQQDDVADIEAGDQAPHQVGLGLEQ